MRDTLNDTINSQKTSQLSDYENIRRRRLMQICTATSIGVSASLLVARSVTVDIFAFALVGLAVAIILAFKHKVQASAYVLLGSMAVMLFALALTGAGLFDLAILGFPGLLIFAAILGGIGEFLTLLFISIVQCIVIVWLNLTGIIVPHTPSASWAHLVFASVLLTVTGFSVFILVNDIKKLMRSLHRENEKVLESQIKIQHLAHHDSLTNLPNRLFGEQLFEQKLKQCDAKQRGLALFFIDLDNFKPVNDALGHAAGDQLLEQLTQRLSEQLNAEQTLIRFGGDEFLVLAPYEGDDLGIKTLAESLIEQ